MIATIIASFVLGQAAGQTPAQGTTEAPKTPKTAAKLISTMLARYTNAKTILGKITFAATVNGASARAETSLAISRPLKVYFVSV